MLEKGEAVKAMNVCERQLLKLCTLVMSRIIIVIVFIVPSTLLFGVNQVGAVTASSAVTFHENDNASDGVYAFQNGSTSLPLTLFSNLSPAFVNLGYTFSEWTTNPDGSGTVYQDGAMYDFANGNLDLFAMWLANHVTFYENDSGVDTVSSTQSSSVDAPLTSFSNLNPSFSNPGYNFAGWTTQASGGGTSYANGANYDFTLGSTSLYAQWSPASFVVNYDANGGTVSSASASFTTGSSPLTLPTPSETGYTFDGWFSAASGGTLVGAAGSAYTPTASTSLYAQWSPASFVVNYDANGGTVSSASASFTTGSSPLTLPTPSETGFTFDGWFSAASGGTLVGAAGSAYTPTASTSLYAQWSAIPVFSITFNANGGVGTVETISGLRGAVTTLPSAASLERLGYEFTGWNTASDGSGLSLAPNANFAIASPVSLYAQWQALPVVTVTLKSNGGTGPIASISTYAGATVSLPTPSVLARPGFVFVGWNTKPNGKGVAYRGNASLVVPTTIVLYAQWRGHAPVALLSPVGPFLGSTTRMTGSLGQQVAHLATLIARQRRSVVTLYGYASNGGSEEQDLVISRARATAVALALRQALARLRDRSVHIVTVAEGLSGGTSNRVAVVVR